MRHLSVRRQPHQFIIINRYTIQFINQYMLSHQSNSRRPKLDLLQFNSRLQHQVRKLIVCVNFLSAILIRI